VFEYLSQSNVSNGGLIKVQIVANVAVVGWGHD